MLRGSKPVSSSFWEQAVEVGHAHWWASRGIQPATTMDSRMLSLIACVCYSKVIGMSNPAASKEHQIGRVLLWPHSWSLQKLRNNLVVSQQVLIIRPQTRLGLFKVLSDGWNLGHVTFSLYTFYKMSVRQGGYRQLIRIRSQESSQRCGSQCNKIQCSTELLFTSLTVGASSRQAVGNLELGIVSGTLLNQFFIISQPLLNQMVQIQITVSEFSNTSAFFREVGGEFAQTLAPPWVCQWSLPLRSNTHVRLRRFWSLSLLF